MQSSEKGVVPRSDVNNNNKEQGEFPILCEKCFGDNPYVRMQKHAGGGTCKMCERPYTLFKWRPGRGEQYRKTEICQTCSKIKNLCQTCILDLEFGLPSQLRDAVLAQGDSTMVVPESDANRQYFASQHAQMIEHGADPWSSRETPNEKLLQVVRNVNQHRAQPRVKLPNAVSKRDASHMAASSAEFQQDPKYHRPEEDIATLPFEFQLPPGVNSSDELAQPVPISKMNNTDEATKATTQKKKPPKPAGPPPPSAFL